MRVNRVSFGKIVIDGNVFTEDIVISNGKIEPRKKSVSRMMKHEYGHTPFTVHENIPWECSTLIIGTGMYGSLPLTDNVFKKAEQLGVKIKLKKTKDAVKYFNEPDTNFVLHITC